MKASPARIFLGLVLGAALGYLCLRSHSPLMKAIPGALAPLGTLFLNAIRVCVIPLVTSALIVGCAASSDAPRLGKLAARSLMVILCYLASAAVFAVIIAVPVFRQTQVTAAPNAREMVVETTRSTATSGGLAEWVGALVPANLFKAATEGALLPLVTFSIAIGITLSRMTQQDREPLLQWFRSVMQLFTRLIDAVLLMAPLGVFCLAINLPATAGYAGLRALLIYVVALSLISGAFILVVLYPSVALFTPVSLLSFMRASAPAQAIAFTSRSSLAALPTTYLAGNQGLGLAEAVSSFFFPFAASIFRVGGCMAQVVGVCFLARFYQVPLSLSQLATVVLSAVAVSLTVPGVPGGAIIVMTPTLAALKIPVEGVAMLLAVDTLPDMFRTAANVTGWLAAGAILSPRSAPSGIQPQSSS